MCSGDEHLARGVVCSGVEGDRSGGGGHVTRFLYIYHFVLHSPWWSSIKEQQFHYLYTLPKSFTLPIILRVPNWSSYLSLHWWTTQGRVSKAYAPLFLWERTYNPRFEVKSTSYRHHDPPVSFLWFYYENNSKYDNKGAIILSPVGTNLLVLRFNIKSPLQRFFFPTFDSIPSTTTNQAQSTSGRSQRPWEYEWDTNFALKGTDTTMASQSDIAVGQ